MDFLARSRRVRRRRRVGRGDRRRRRRPRRAAGRARARVRRRPAGRTPTRSTSRRGSSRSRRAVDGPDWMDASARARRGAARGRARFRMPSRTTSSWTAEVGPWAEAARVEAAAGSRGAAPAPADPPGRRARRRNRAGRRPGRRRCDAARVRACCSPGRWPAVPSGWCSAHGSRSTRPSSSSPTVVPGLDVQLAVREDANAIDALCRLALRAYEDWCPDAGARGGGRRRRRGARAERRRDVRRARHRDRAVRRAPRDPGRRSTALPRPAAGVTASGPSRTVGATTFRSASSCPRSTRPRSSRRRSATSSKACGARHEPFEVIVVENGSTDGTLAIATRSGRRSIPRSRVEHRADADYGAALRAGLARAPVATRSSTSTSTSSTSTFLDAAVGARHRAPAVPRSSSGRSAARAPRTNGRRLRQLVTATFALLLRVLFGLKVSDTHGMKAMRRAAVEPVARACRFGAGPVRHRADPAGRARRTPRRRDPGRGRGTATGAHVDPPARAPYAARAREAADRALAGPHLTGAGSHRIPDHHR